ncbi:MAG: FtsX-like permease family protein [Roseobacter sp.]
MMLQGAAALWSHWRRNPWQLITLLAGIALSTALWSGVQAINAEARASYDEASDFLGASDLARVVKINGGQITIQDYVELRRSGWLVTPIYEGLLMHQDAPIRVIGIDPLTFPSSSLSDNTTLSFSSMQDSAPLALAHPETASRLVGLGLNVRLDDARPPGTVMLDIRSAEQLTDKNVFLKHLVLNPNAPMDRGKLPTEFQLTQIGVKTDVARLTDSFHLNLTAFGMLSFAVGIFIVYGAVGLAFEQRRAVFRTLRALGLPLYRLMMLLVAEFVFFALSAGAIGVVLGYAIAASLMPDVAATLRGLYGAEIAGQLQLRPEWWLAGLGMALTGTGVAASAALFKLAHMPLLSFNHPQAMALGTAQSGRWLACLTLILFSLGGLLATFGSGLIAGFSLLACLLLGSAFSLPWFLAQFLSWAQGSSRHVIAQWFWADSRQQLPGLSMALMALLLAMAANIGVSTMVSSFRLTFIGYLDQRLAAELYVSVPNEALSNEIFQYLETRQAEVLPLVSVDVRLGGLPAEIFAVRDHATYRDHWPLLDATPEVWDLLAAGQGALINEQLARRQNWRVGDVLPSGDNLLGIYSDYGNSSGQMILGATLFAERYPDAPTLRFGVRTKEAETLAQELISEFNLSSESIVNQQEIKDTSLRVFERTFAVTAALNVLTLSVAGLAILISLLTLATMRLPQLAPVWALGMTRVGLSRLELVRAVCLAALTSVLAVPVGLALAWVLLAVVNVEAFGWRLPMYLFPLDYLKLGGLTLLAALLAAFWPAIKLAKTNSQSLLKVFSNDR